MSFTIFTERLSWVNRGMSDSIQQDGNALAMNNKCTSGQAHFVFEDSANLQKLFFDNCETPAISYLKQYSGYCQFASMEGIQL